MTRATHVVVVGGGIAGLAAAHAVARTGQQVTVLEAASRVGGKLRVGELAGIDVDEGAESFLQRVPEALELARAVGLGDRLATPATTGASVWARGALRPIPAGTVLGVPSRLPTLSGVLTRREVARAAADRLLPGDAPVEDVAVGAWVRRRLGPAVVERLVDPLLGGVYAGRADELSLAATLPQLPRDERSALAAARRVIAEGVGGTGDGGRGRPGGPVGPPAPVFATVSGGLGVLPAAVADAVTGAGGSVYTRRTVRRIERSVTGWRVVYGATNDEHLVEADAVVLALPAAPAARLLSDIAPTAAAELAGVEAASMAIVTTVWPAVAAEELPGTGYLVPAVYGRAVKAVTFASAKWAHLAAPDRQVVRCSIGRYRDVGDLQRDDDHLVAAAVAELTIYAGFRGRPLAARVTRWGGGLPQYAVGHLDRVARIQAAVAAVPGLAVCGASYAGVGVPACIRTGTAAARQVLAATTGPTTSP